MEQSWPDISPLHTEIDILRNSLTVQLQQPSLEAGISAAAAVDRSSEMADVSNKPPRKRIPPSKTCIISFENLNSEPKPIVTEGEKKIRSKVEILYHNMKERERRQKLAHKFTELSATLPGFKKIDKTSIVLSAIQYVEQLKNQVMELEQQNKRDKEPMIILDKEKNSHAIGHTTSSELLPDVKAKVLEKDILIYINCEKENGIELKLLKMLENLHLFVTSTSVLPYGNSTLGITIIAKIGNAYRMTTTNLVCNVRQWLLNGAGCHVTRG